MAFRQSALPVLSRRYSSPARDAVNDGVLASPVRGRTSQHDTHYGPISDFGSLNTIAQSGEEELSDIIEDEVDDLDSLDDGLQAFREPSLYRASDIQNAAILPAHDGLGSFHPARNPIDESMLQSDGQLTSNLRSRFEPFSKFDDVYHRQQEEDSLESTRYERIERWRLEQSKVVLEEIEKERQRAETKQRLQEKGLAQSKSIGKSNESQTNTANPEGVAAESIWQRLARHVMKDFIGLDDDVLSAIFGEDLMPEDFSKTPTKSMPVPAESTDKRKGVLGSLIQELRQMAQGLTTDTTATKDELEQCLDYAGIPLSWLEDRQKPTASSNPSSSTQFKPTLGSSKPVPKPVNLTVTVAESEYWEQTPNLKTVISYLYRRFRSQPPPSTPPPPTKYLPTTSMPKTQDAAYRAAIIQQHHPLTSRHHHLNHSRNKKHHRQSSFLSSHKPGSAASGLPYFTSLKRRGSSCASWSTKRSRRGESSGSRNYWDLGESVGSGSMVFAGVGAWGEV